MKRVSFPHFLVWVALLAAAFPALVANGQSEKLRVTISSISTSQVNVWVPLNTGFFKKQGLDVELVYKPAGTSRAGSVTSQYAPTTRRKWPSSTKRSSSSKKRKLIATTARSV
jgi:hypothetical protein